MIRLILIFSVSRAFGDMSMEHSVYMSSNSKSNSQPTKSSYTYSRNHNEPGFLSTYGYSSEPSSPIVSYGTLKSEEHFEPPNFEYADPEISRPVYRRTVEITEPPLTKYAVDAAIAKAEAKYNSKFLPLKMKTDTMYERLRSVMHYHPPDNTLESPLGYDMHDYHLDDDDVRTSSRGLYDSWPYFYHSPYEYEHMKIDSEIKKAKDKRYVVDTMSVIPVYSKGDEAPNSYDYNMLDIYREPTTDNPILGNAPFFSFVLNEYFNKNNYDDSLSFKGIDWGKDFDYQPRVADIDSYTKNKRQDLENDQYTPTSSSYNIDDYLFNHVSDKTLKNYGGSTEKSYEKKNKYDKFEKGDNHKENSKSTYEHNGKLYKSFKDFIDSFANKFGKEDHKKDSKYLLKMNQDKGENKKGFRRVYHKDEYQEDNDFYDNKNKSAKAEESGSSKAHVGGSEVLLKSYAAAALGDEDSFFNKAAGKEDGLLENSLMGHDILKDSENQLNRYRDIAKKAAESNSIDYTDHYRT